MANINLFVVQKHAIDGFNGSSRGFSGLVVNEAVPLGATMLVSSDLARKNVAERGEGVMKRLRNNWKLTSRHTWNVPCYQWLRRDS